MLIDGEEYDFTPTYDPKQAANYEGYIGPNGEFYKVSKKFIHEPMHGDWAFEFIRYMDEQGKKGFDMADELKAGGPHRLLINKNHGFIYYSHNTHPQRKNEPIIVLPKNYVFLKKRKQKLYGITQKQLEMLYNILAENNELRYLPEKLQKAVGDLALIRKQAEDDLHENYVDRFIQKRLDEEQRKK